MNRFFVAALAVLFVAGSLFAQPVSEAPVVQEDVPVRVVALKGPTAMGMVKLMTDAEEEKTEGSNRYSFQLESAPDAIVPLLAKGEVDIAAIPANLASTVYNNTDKVRVIAINTLGVLYIVGNENTVITSREDLLGATIYSSGKGSTPQYALETILHGYGLEIGKDVTVEWKSEHAECVASLAADKSGKCLAMLPQPFATSALLQNKSLKVLLDLNDLWENLSGTKLVTGCAVVTKAFAEAHPEAVEAFLASYKASVDWVNTNNAEAAELIEKYGIIKAAVAQKALPYCNIVCWTGSELRSAMDVYLNALYNQNPKSVGGAVPGEAFYF